MESSQSGQGDSMAKSQPAAPAPQGHVPPAVRPASLTDVDRVVAVHLATLPANLSDFTPLGVPVVKRFYRNIIKRRLGTLLVSLEDDVATGFALITPDVHDCMHGTLVGNPADVFFLLTRAPWIALLRAFFGGTHVTPHVPELVYIAVDAACHSRGHGRALLAAVEQEVRRLGLRGYQLNVMADNARAIRLYESCGFTVTRHFSRRGHAMLTMSVSW